MMYLSKQKQIGKKKRKNRKRVSLNGDTCFFCEGPAVDLHEAFRGRNRQLCVDYGLIFGLCTECHSIITLNPTCDKDLELRKYAKKRFEINYPLLDFKKIFI